MIEYKHHHEGFKRYEFTFICPACGAYLTASAKGPDEHQAHGNALSVVLNNHVYGLGGSSPCPSTDHSRLNPSNYNVIAAQMIPS